jgi:transposase
LARELFAIQAKEYVDLEAQIDEVDAKLTAWHRSNECSQCLAKIPGIGPIGAVLLRMKTPEPELPTVRGLDRLDAEGSFDRW